MCTVFVCASFILFFSLIIINVSPQNALVHDFLKLFNSQTRLQASMCGCVNVFLVFDSQRWQERFPSTSPTKEKLLMLSKLFDCSFNVFIFPFSFLLFDSQL